MFYLLLFFAGGSGVLCRYFVGRAAINFQWVALPFGTLIVNVVGSFLMGYLSWVMLQKWQMSKEVQLIILTGFLGGFTTFSAFSLEMVSLIEDGSFMRAVVYLLASVSLCLVMCLLGLWLARHS